MYIWRIEKLKAKMAARPLSEREVLPYLAVSVALTSASMWIPPADLNWDAPLAVSSVLLAVGGLLYAYVQNGGATGHHFLQRYFAIGWVVGIRCFVAFMLAVLAIEGTLLAIGIDTDTMPWFDLLFLTIAGLILYWRIGHHVGDLAKRALASDMPEGTFESP